MISLLLTLPPRRPRSTARQRGSVYLLVLSTAMLVTIIGAGGLLALRAQRQAAIAQQDANAARLLAQSAVDVALAIMETQPDWRTLYAHNSWSHSRAAGSGTLNFKYIDDADGSLSNDASQRVRIIGQGVVGNAVRTVSVVVWPPNAANLLANPGLESGTTGWSGYRNSDEADLEHVADVVHTGSASVHVKSRDADWAGIRQTLTSAVENGVTYNVQIWVRMRDSTDTVKLYARTNASSSGNRTTLVASATASHTGWVQLSGSWKAEWSGTLSEACIWVCTTLDKRDFYLDDAVVRQATNLTPTLVPGSWAQVVE